MKELVVVSGKGGTGKTSLLASFAALARDAVLADCDVEAADLHLVVAPEVRERHEFRSGRKAVIQAEHCTACGVCLARCRFGAVERRTRENGETTFSIAPLWCEGCAVCVRSCPAKAIDFLDYVCGEWYVSETRFGPMVHARLGVAAENSGKLVAVIRKEARRIAQERGKPFLLVDGPPGIGCPVIASLTGATAVLAVTEPTLSGEHDLDRVLELSRHFDLPAFVCVNRWDINPVATERIERRASEWKAHIVGRIAYDRIFTDAQIKGESVIERGDTPAARSIRQVWEGLCSMIP